LSGKFAHLHVRSGFSYGFRVATPEDLPGAAVKMGMGALALTDRDGLYGVPRFLKASKEFEISPIVGVEISTAEGYLVLLAESVEGCRSLCRLITEYRISSEDRRKPRCPLKIMLQHSQGLVCLTGAVPFGLLPRLLLDGQREKAKRTLLALREAFEGRLFVELTDDGTAGSQRRVGRVAEFAREGEVPVVATNEVAYVSPGDHRLHEVLVAAKALTTLPGPDYRPTDRLYLRSAERMHRLFADYPEALGNVKAVTERCAGAVRLSGEVHMPVVRTGLGGSAERELQSLVREGTRRRYGETNPEMRRRVAGRLRGELSCIERLGFAPYFLIANEAAGIAHEKGIPVTGRGSAANSMVAYCLRLTSPEPLSNRLLFERFMHEGRDTESG